MPDKADITILAEEKKTKLRERIADLCSRRMYMSEKDELCKLVLDSLRETGSFYSNEGSLLYFHKSSGELIDLHHRKRDLAAVLSREFSLNSNDAHTKRVMESIRNHAHNFAIDVQLHSLARYDNDSDTLFLDIGNGNVLQITIDAEPTIVQMSAETGIFTANPEFSCWQYIPIQDRNPDVSISSSIFQNFLVQESKRKNPYLALINVFLLSVLFPEEFKSRPILLFTGDKGCGKTTAMRSLGLLLMGSKFDVTASVTDLRDFETILVQSPLVAIDNVDESIKALEDPLATATTGGNFKRRKLYSDDTLYDRKARAAIGITSRNPKFRRDDLNSRVLRIPFSGTMKKRSETSLANLVTNNRNQLMSELVDNLRSCLSALREAKSIDFGTKLRMADFGVFAQKIAPALGYTPQEMLLILEVMQQEQLEYAGESDPFLEVFFSFCDSDEFVQGKEYPTGELHRKLTIHARDNELCYPCKIASTMGKKLNDPRLQVEGFMNRRFEIDYHPVRAHLPVHLCKPLSVRR